MTLRGAQRLVLIAALALVCSFGAFGAFVGYSLEEDHQSHGVEPGPEATWALRREAASGFVAGAGSGAFIAGAFALLARYLLRRRFRREV
jgi:hypothetical protein